MNQRNGITATVALLFAALLGMTYLPRNSADNATAGVAGKPVARAAVAGASSSQKPASSVIPSCQQIRLRLSRFYPPADQVPVPPDGGCYPQGQRGPVIPPPAQSPLSFAIAIVPNPVQTHLPLMFDRQIDAIQQAVQDTGFNYDGSWFPWNQSDKSYGSLSDEQQSAAVMAELQEQPGIMVFRQSPSQGVHPAPYEQGMVVFVVAEQPTGGISDVQFTHALDWIEALQPNGSDLRIIGPTFSGSLASLARGLTVNGAFSKFSSITAFSGATNADDNVNWFNRFLAEQQAQRVAAGEKHPTFTFLTFFESDSLMTDRFLCYMQHEGYNLANFAILSEDETAFGKAGTKGATEKPRCQDHEARHEGKPIYLYYPRDIATLRSAYEQQGIFNVGKADANAPSTSLKTNLSEPVNSEHDTVRTYAGQLTPQTQEAALFGISNVLDQKHIQFVILRSSNTLDQLFLSEFLRRSYPSGRVVIDGADLMFRRGLQGASLRGVILLSPYPLLSWTHDAVATIGGGRSFSYRVFPQDSSEGTYIATRQLLQNVPGAVSAVSISDYAEPRSAAPLQKPPTWVTVVGHRQFWPLAVLSETTDVDADGKTHFGPFGTSLLQPQSVEHDAPRRQGRLPDEMWALLLFCLVLGGLHYYFCANASLYRPPRMRANFAPVPRLQHTALIFIGSLLLAFLLASLCLMIWFGYKVLADSTLVGLFSIASAVIVLSFLGCSRNYRLHVITGEIDTARTTLLGRIRVWRKRLQRAWFPVLIALVLVRYFFLTYHLSPANEFPTFWRSMYLRSGVSPLLPQVILILGLYAWFYFNLHGLALFGDDRPVLPKVDDLPHFNVVVDHADKAHPQPTRPVKAFRVFSQEGAGNNIEGDALPLGRRYLKSLAIFVPIAFVVLWVALGEPALRTLGDIRFGRAIFFAVAVYVGLILADTKQLLDTWSQLRQLLTFLDRLRLRRTLATMRGLYGESVWKLSGNVLEERYRLISRQFESMRNLHNALKKWTTSSDEEERRKLDALDQLDQCEIYGRAFTTWYVDLLDDDLKDPVKEYDTTPFLEFQRLLALTAAGVMRWVLAPEWQSDSNTMIRVSCSKDLEADFDKQVAELPPHVSAAEEFFLLPYVGFIQNILGRVRALAFSIVTLFVAVTLAVSCYPFDPLPVIGAVFLVLFALVGCAMVITYAGMCRDATLSRIANTKPGELGWGFWAKTIAFGAGPLLGLLSTLFPSMTDFIVSFLQPGAQALK